MRQRGRVVLVQAEDDHIEFFQNLGIFQILLSHR